MQVQSLIEQMLFTTVRITTTSQSGNGLGTGFLWMKTPDAEGNVQMFLVTNKHVIDGTQSAELHFIGGEPSGPVLGKAVTCAVQSPTTSFVGHPDPDIDVAVMPIGGMISTLNTAGHQVYVRAVSETQGATEASLSSFEPIEPVTFIGYPNGLYDSASLLPIVRRGHSATALTVNYEGKPIFLIDASVFPGSSGSPVFLMRGASAPDKFGNITIGGPQQVIFLGVVAAVYQRTVPVLTAGSGQFVHDALDIGLVYKANAVSEAVDACIAKLGTS